MKKNQLKVFIVFSLFCVQNLFASGISVISLDEGFEEKKSSVDSWVEDSTAFKFLLDNAHEINVHNNTVFSPQEYISQLMKKRPSLSLITRERRDTFRIHYCKLYIDALNHDDLLMQQTLKSGENNDWSPVKPLALSTLIAFLWKTATPGWIWNLGPMMLEKPTLQLIIQQPQIELGHFLEISLAIKHEESFQQLMDVPNINLRFSEEVLYETWSDIIKTQDHKKITLFLEKFVLASDLMLRINFFVKACSIQDDSFRQEVLESLIHTKLPVKNLLIGT